MRDASAKPEIGGPATICYVSDTYPATVTAISPSGKTVTVQGDDYRVVSGSGHDGSAQYDYAPNPNGIVRVARLGKDGYYRTAGRGQVVVFGRRRMYRDPHF